MARPGMAQIISMLRTWGQVAEDEEFNGVTYWTDDQLEDVADTKGKFESRLILPVLPTLETQTQFTIYRGANLYFEDGAFTVTDPSNTVIDTAVTYDPNRQLITFATAVVTQPYTITGFAVPIMDALAELWAIKYAQRQDYVSWKAGQNKMDRNQEPEHCFKMMEYYRNRSMRVMMRPNSSRWSV